MTSHDHGRAERLLRPPAETIVGFSEESGPGPQLLRNLTRPDCLFAGPVYLVNPRRAAAGDSRYLRSAADVRGPLGFVHVLLSGEQALGAIRRLNGDISAVAVYGGGFGDAGRDDLEHELAEWSAHNLTGCTVPVLGPQSMGIYRYTSDFQFCGITGPSPEPAKPGPVAFVSQSGALVGAFLRACWSRGLGASCAISIGNGRGFTFADAAVAALNQPDISVLCMYLEGVARLRDLADVGELAAHLGKIVVLAVGGQSAGGSALATSHTGALATEHRLVSGVARQFGIIPAVDVEELVWAAEAICRAGARLRVPRHRSDVALIGLTGGGVILAADALARSGVPLEQPTARGAARIRRVVGPKEILNPVDGGALALTLADSHGALVDAYVDDPRYQIVACVAGMGLPPPTPSHIHLYDALAAGTARTRKIGVLVSPLPDAANGPWDMPGLVTARSMHEGAVKIRVLRDVLRADAGSHARADVPATTDELAGARA